MSHAARRTTTALVIILSLISGLILIEMTARLLLPDLADDNSFHRHAWNRLLSSQAIFSKSDDHYDERFGYQYSSNVTDSMTIKDDDLKYTVQTNSIGYRTQEIYLKDHDEYRVLMTGDSFFWGNGLDNDDMISARLEITSADDERFMDQVTVFNYGVPGYNTVHQNIVVDTYGKQIDPDLVIVGFFIGNDVIPNAFVSIDGRGNYESTEQMASALMARLEQAMWPWSASVALRSVLPKVMIPRIRYQLSLEPEIMGASLAWIDRMGAQAQHLNADFAVVIIYPRLGVQGGLIEHWLNSRAVAEKIRDHCIQYDIPFVDLIDFIEGADDSAKYYYEHDGHFNPEGASRVAQIIYDQIIVPRRGRR